MLQAEGPNSFVFRVGQIMLTMGFSMKFSVAARSKDLCTFNGNMLAPYTGVMVCMYVCMT